MKHIIQRKVTKIIKGELPPHTVFPRNAVDVPIHMLGVDSLSFLSIIIALEDEFHIHFPEEKMTMAQMKTIRILCITILELINEQGD